MKKFRFTLPLLAFIVAIAASAFTAFPSHKAVTGLTFFDYNGGNQLDPANYTKRLTQPPSGNVCPGSAVLCGIWANEDGSNSSIPAQSDIDALYAAYGSNGEFNGEHINEVDFRAQ